jgi:3-(methylthio)propanoyl-CoA dehydrogenase
VARDPTGECSVAENFFLDNRDLQFHLKHADLRQVLALNEKGYANHEKYSSAPRHYEDARDNYRLLLEVMGDICANVVAPRAAEADEEGAQFRDGQVYYTAATQEALAAFRRAELYGVMLPW